MHDSEESPNKHEDEVVRENFPAAQSKIGSELSEWMGIELNIQGC